MTGRSTAGGCSASVVAPRWPGPPRRWCVRLSWARRRAPATPGILRRRSTRARAAPAMASTRTSRTSRTSSLIYSGSMTEHGVVYLRISKDPTGRGLGIERQLQECQELAASLGVTLVGIYDDNDLSGYTGGRRPGFLAMSERLRQGGINYLFCWHNDRLTRNARELEKLIDLLDQTGTTVQTVTAGTYDLSTPTGRMTARVVGATATYHSEHMIEQVKAKQRQKALAGQWHGGVRPFGYQVPSGEIIPSERDAIHEGARMILDGLPVRAVMRAWNAAGTPTTKANRWTSSMVSKTLKSPYLAGLRVYQGSIVGEATWQEAAILDRATWDHLVAILEDPERTKAHGRACQRPSRCPRCWPGAVLAGGHRMSSR